MKVFRHSISNRLVVQMLVEMGAGPSEGLHFEYQNKSSVSWHDRARNRECIFICACMHACHCGMDVVQCRRTFVLCDIDECIA